MKKKNLIKIYNLIVLALLSTFAITNLKKTIDWGVVQESGIITQLIYGVYYLFNEDIIYVNIIFLVSLSIFYKLDFKINLKSMKRYNSREYYIYICAVILTCFMVIGDSFYINGDLGFVFHGKKQFVYAIMTSIGYFYSILAAIYIIEITIKKIKFGKKARYTI